MRILVTGASGFAGSLLVPRLLADGHAVRALGRDPARVSAALASTAAPEGRPPGGRRPSGGSPPGGKSPEGGLPRGTSADGAADLSEVEVLRGDALSGAGLDAALAGVEVAYYLIHSMERPSAGELVSFEERDLIAARNFAAACSRAGVARIVYLGGLLPRDRAASRHLASRESVERILLDAIPGSLALRASIVIGARSRSFRFLVRLVERLPVLTLPAWRSFRTAPIDERDVTEMLAAAASVSVSDASTDAAGAAGVTTTGVAGGDAAIVSRSLDIGGPDVLSYGEMISRIADLMLVRRPVVGFGVNLTPVAARVAAAIASEDPELILPLMESLAGDLLPRDSASDSNAAGLLGVRLHSFDSAVEHALRVWEESEPLSAR
jgi:uncharacterized protein YbjT (DUF2867 family)